MAVEAACMTQKYKQGVLDIEPEPWNFLDHDAVR